MEPPELLAEQPNQGVALEGTIGVAGQVRRLVHDDDVGIRVDDVDVAIDLRFGLDALPRQGIAAAHLGGGGWQRAAERDTAVADFLSPCFRRQIREPARQVVDQRHPVAPCRNARTKGEPFAVFLVAVAATHAGSRLHRRKVGKRRRESDKKCLTADEPDRPSILIPRVLRLLLAADGDGA